MKWTVVFLVIAVLITLWTIGLEYALPMGQASALAERLAAPLGTPEATLRRELEPALSEGMLRRMVVRAAPMSVLLALLTFRLNEEYRNRRKFRDTRSFLPRPSGLG